MTRSISPKPQPLSTDATFQARAVRSADLPKAPEFTRNRRTEQVHTYPDKGPVNWIRQHLGQQPASPASTGAVLTPPDVHLAPFYPPHVPLAPIPNLHVGDAPYRAQGVTPKMTGWNYHDPIREHPTLFYTRQPLPPGVFPVGVDPNDPSITHF